MASLSLRRDDAGEATPSRCLGDTFPYTRSERLVLYKGHGLDSSTGGRAVDWHTYLHRPPPPSPSLHRRASATIFGRPASLIARLLHMEALLPSSSGISPKISTILQSHVYPRFGRVLRALARVKSALLDALGKTKYWGTRRRRRRKQLQQHRAKKRSSSSRHGGGGGFAKRPPPHLSWSGGGGLTSPVRSAAEMALDVDYHVYPSYESVWNAVVVPAAAPGEYCGYLRWLEEEMPNEVLVVEEGDDDDEGEDDQNDSAGGNEIDRLAEQFIARCRANFLLEKQESYDRCQEMIARSL